MADAFHGARVAARELHAKLVEQGADPDRPTDLLARAAEALDVDLYWHDRDAPAPDLDGAIARFDHAFRLIALRRQGSVDGDDRLLAHELGHVEQLRREGGASSSGCSADDLGRRPGAAYGPHQRRELWANVFGRHILLPSDRARALHVDGGLDANAIAARTGLSIDLVRLQLVDALLPTPPASTARPSPELDEAQLRAARHRGLPLVIHAGPGTGKTATLTGRVVSLIDEGVDPATILVLTYSTHAARELVDRVARTVGTRADGLWVSTFHAFGLELVRRHHRALGLPANPECLDLAAATRLLEDGAALLALDRAVTGEPALVLADILRGIAQAKDELEGPETIAARADALPARTIAEVERRARALEIARVYEVYQEALAARGAVDFGDQIMLPVQLLETDEAAREALRAEYGHVLCDEYQDVNTASARLLEIVAGDASGSANHCVVGDPRQGIYGFRGADASRLVRFTTRYPDASIHRLDASYRSSSEILEKVGAFAARMALGSMENDTPDPTLRPASMVTRPPGPSAIEARAFASPEEEARGVAREIARLVRTGTAPEAQMVLARSRARLVEIAGALDRAGIPYALPRDLLADGDARDLLAVASLTIDGDGHALPRIAAMDRYAIRPGELRPLLEGARRDDAPGAVFRKLQRAAERLSAETRASVARLAGDLVGLPPSPWALLMTYVFERVGAARWTADPRRAGTLWRVLGLAGEHETVAELLDRARMLSLIGEGHALGPSLPAGALPGVQMLTIHASKGLEAEAVHVTGLSQGTLPVRFRQDRGRLPAGVGRPRTQDDHRREEECLFFVAASRAKRVLRLSRAVRERGEPRAPSPFLGWMGVRARVVRSSAESGRPPRGLAAVPPVGATGASEAVEAEHAPRRLRLRGPAVELYARCGRRFYYEEALGLSAGAAQGALARTRSVLRALSMWAIDRPESPTDTSLRAELDRLFVERGPREGPFVDHHRALAEVMAARLGEALREVSGTPVTVALGLSRGDVQVKLHRVGARDDQPVARVIQGAPSARRAASGASARSSTSVRDALFTAAAHQVLGPEARVEIVDLATGRVARLATGEPQARAARARIDELLRGIAAGRFPANAQPAVCARCPHLFGCEDGPSRAPGRF